MTTTTTKIHERRFKTKSRSFDRHQHLIIVSRVYFYLLRRSSLCRRRRRYPSRRQQFSLSRGEVFACSLPRLASSLLGRGGVPCPLGECRFRERLEFRRWIRTCPSCGGDARRGACTFEFVWRVVASRAFWRGFFSGQRWVDSRTRPRKRRVERERRSGTVVVGIVGARALDFCRQYSPHLVIFVLK